MGTGQIKSIVFGKMVAEDEFSIAEFFEESQKAEQCYKIRNLVSFYVKDGRGECRKIEDGSQVFHNFVFRKQDWPAGRN